MQTGNSSSNRDIVAGSKWTPEKRRQLFAGLCLALLTGAAIGTVDTASRAPGATFSSIEGNIIVAFDVPSAVGTGNRFSVDCNAVIGDVRAHGEAASSPVVVGGLIAGDTYDCHARPAADTPVSDTARVLVMGQD
ncbi:MAG TPA: hypothetical protein VF928_00870 [Usitatibacteraceae bacterium]